MSRQTFTLSYQNEDDRAFGLAGMAISLAALDAIDRVVEVSLDAEGPMVTFSHAYYFSGSPSISPKSTWDNLIRNLHITTAMALSNVYARSVVRMKHDAPQESLDAIYREVKAEGEETCGLEEDEISALYNNTLTLARRIFNNPRRHPAIEQFAGVLSRRRVLSGMEIQDELHALQLGARAASRQAPCDGCARAARRPPCCP